MQQLGHDDNDQYQGHAAGHLSLWAGVGEVEVRLVALFMFVTKVMMLVIIKIVIIIAIITTIMQQVMCRRGQE